MTTTINGEYRLRLAGVALVIAAMGAWFAYDGAIGYPQKNAQHAVFVQKLEALGEKTPTPAEWLKENDEGVRYIDEFAQAAGVKLASSKVEEIKSTQMKIEQAQKSEASKQEIAAQIAQLEQYVENKLKAEPYEETAIQTQFGFAVFAFLFAGFLVALLVVRSRTVFAADDECVMKNNEHFAYSELTGIDWSKWHEKQIVRLNFGNRSLTLDGWHYAHVDELVAQVLAKRPDFTMPEKPAKGA